MIIYEVNLLVDADIAEAYAKWLAQHVREMIALPGFLSATWYRDAEQPQTGHVAWCVQYQLASGEDLDEYFAEHAPRMRGEGMERFEGRFTASRRVLETVESYEAAE